ncbi:MAG: M28 family peptidase [Clostridia bacterium]|nr:M28 family peptidase [Clostridia bacterium]
MEKKKGATSRYTRWICEQIKETCIRHGGRPGGSASALGAMHDMMEIGRELSDTAELHPFKMHPEAFASSFLLSAFFDVIGVNFFLLFCFYPYPVLSFLSAVSFFISISVLVFEFFLYLPFTDFLYPGRKSHNLLLTKRARGTSRRKIILVGHCDSAYEMPYMNKLPRFLLIPLIIGAITGKLFSLTVGIALPFAEGSGISPLVFGGLECFFLLFFVPFLFFVNFDGVTHGANDNLTGCYLGLSILKELTDLGQRLEQTDLCCLVTDGEESGLRGAFAFAKEKREELSDGNTVVIAIDTIHSPSELMIYDRGINFTQKNGDRAKRLIEAAGYSLGIKIPKAPFYPGATDAEAFSRFGIEATAICAVSHGVCDYYHSLSDTHLNLSEPGIEFVRKILISAIKIYDSGEGV